MRLAIARPPLRLDHHHLPILASLFRQQQPGASRSTTYPTGLQPVASDDPRGNRQLTRRVSRTDLDFEQALKAPGTVLLREGIDVNALGVENSPGPVTRTTSTPRTISRVALQPATPVVVPPTPQQQPQARLHTFSGPSPSGSAHDLFADQDEAERQTNRRSMYRSPGTSSSPDLATLLRKAKERGGVMVGNSKREKRRESPPPPLPDRQPVSSSSTTLVASPSGQATDWSLGSPKAGKSSGTIKAPKNSVRAKTSAFWGKVIGQGTVRERSKTDAAQLMNVFVPPTEPPPPMPVRPNVDQGKPLPPIRPHDQDDNERDDQSLVIVEGVSPATPTPAPAPVVAPISRTSVSNSSTITNKRRSMSVSEADLRNVPPPVFKREEAPAEATLNGFLEVFKGEPFSLEPFPTSGLALRDPSRQSLNKTNDRVESTSIARPVSLTAKRSNISVDEPSSPPSSAPPRSSSLHATARYSLGSPGPRQLPPLRSRSGTQSPHRLKGLHRSTASSSEPSLIPVVHSAPNRMSSQQELSVSDFSTGEGDIESRGKGLATKCWDDSDEFLPKEKIAEWLGGTGQINRISLRHYMEFFDFGGLRLDIAFRNLCSKLYLKAETQQVDRILEQFSKRYWECNPKSIYSNYSVVHAVSYSLLLLNTDLHVADLQARMSRSQFVRNTLAAIQMQFQSSPSPPPDDDGASSVHRGSDETETMTRSKRSDSITSWNSLSREAILAAQGANGSTPSVQVSNDTSQQSTPLGKAWEADMETLLKEMYTAIKHQQILQPISVSHSRPSTSSLSPGGPSRHRSLRNQQDRLTALKKGGHRLSSVLGVQSPSSPYSSSSSVDGRVSPSPSFATSTHELWGSSSTFLNPTLGFVSNLSHTAIREAQEDDDRSIASHGSDSTTISISDEELALLGAPWAKEGMLCRKYFWEAAQKRAKDKSWLDVFVVIQKGQLSMFVFGENTGTGGGTVGGGNWLANARLVGTISLAHCLAHALPPPGYHRRPHCMVLTLANQGVYFFQAGTEELVNEWVSTVNYWAARTSKEPLAGGVSNMEYGWNRVDPHSHGRSQSQTDLPREPDFLDSVSIRSGKSNRSKYGWRDGAATMRTPRTDKTYINEWKPPMPPSVASTHDEETQMEALKKHVSSLKIELEAHNELREPMMTLYIPRSSNAERALKNWGEKSQYLLREIVKYDLYIDSLQSAMTLRLKKRGEKALERALSAASPEDPDQKPTRRRSIDETEPLTPSARQTSHPIVHRRETAEPDDDDED